MTEISSSLEICSSLEISSSRGDFLFLQTKELIRTHH